MSGALTGTMVLALELKSRGISLEASWIPRELNVEADRLSNMDGSGFDLTKRITLESSDLSWHILEDALRWGAQLQRAGGLGTERDSASSATAQETRPEVYGSRTLGEVKFSPTAQTAHEPGSLTRRQLHAVRSEGGTWQITLVYGYSSQCDSAPAASRSFVRYLGRTRCALTGWLHSPLDAFAGVADWPSRHLCAPDCAQDFAAGLFSDWFLVGALSEKNRKSSKGKGLKMDARNQ